ncbi:MAG: Acetyltransferase family [Candidatus Saccharibacteria bacterium]|nr:Acetyltransferase family [Candidatus Saccharibacteria bacterium]
MFSLPESYSLSTAQLDDTSEVADFLQLQYRLAYQHDTGLDPEFFSSRRFRNRLEDYLEFQIDDPHTQLLLARKAEVVKGTIGLVFDRVRAQRAKVWGFYVDQAAQGNGLGRGLWSHTMEVARLSGVEDVYLEVAKGATEAIEFYQNRGLVVTDETKSTWPGNWGGLMVETSFLTMERSGIIEQ